MPYFVTRKIDFEAQFGVMIGPMDTRAPVLFITRQVEFSAAHRLYRPELSEEKNFDLFGPCANPYGHGHNYLFEATFKGVRSEETQMVVHFNQLKRLLDELVLAPLDHRHLNHDVAFLKDTLPTSENLVCVLWDRIAQSILGQGFSLYKVRLSSSSRNWVEYFGSGDVRREHE